MKENSKNIPVLSIILFVTIVTLINSVSNMIAPNNIAISNYFGFGGDLTPIGILTSSFTLVTGLIMLIFGFLADKIVRKWIVFTGALVFSIFSALTITIPSGIQGYYLFFFFTIMTSMGYGALIPSIFSLMGDIISKSDRSKGFSFFSIASLIGMLVGTATATFLGYDDWRLPFLIIGIAGLTSSLIFLLFKEPSRIGIDHRFLMDKEAVEYTYRIKFQDLRVIFKKKANVWLVVNFVDTIPTGIILFLLFAYMEEYHGIASDVTLFLMLLILFSTLIGTILFGYIGDRRFKAGYKKARVKLALLGNLVPIPFIFIAIIIPFSPSNLFPGILIFLLLFCIGMFANGAVNGNWYATVVDINLPEHRGTVLAASNFFDIIGRAIGPLIGALFADTFGTVYGMMISLVFWVLIPLFWVPVLRNIVPNMEETERIFTERLEILK